MADRYSKGDINKFIGINMNKGNTTARVLIQMRNDIEELEAALKPTNEALIAEVEDSLSYVSLAMSQGKQIFDYPRGLLTKCLTELRK
jgi:hypothetical protein